MTGAAPDRVGLASVCVVGNGYVGTVVAASLAFLGYRVVGLETDGVKLGALRSGRAPFHEPGLDQLLECGLERGTLAFTDDPEEAIATSQVAFFCIGSPSGPGGSVDLRPLESAALALAPWLRPDHVLVIKSTVPVGTSVRMRALLSQASGLDPAEAPAVVSNPEFLRQGSAVHDFLHPDRIVLGGDVDSAVDVVARIYRPILEERVPGPDRDHKPVLVRTSAQAAEAAKYAANAFLAAKVSFVNEMANICDRVGADIGEVAKVMGLDHRIGPEFLHAGLGWGGSCFAKDLDALIVAALEAGYDPQLLRAVREINQRQLEVVMAKLARHLSLSGARVALLGLAYKPGTDDLRGAPAVQLARRLRLRGAVVTAFDPVVQAVTDIADVSVTTDPFEAADSADAVVVVTDWPQLRQLDLAELRTRMRGEVLVDGRNIFDPQQAARAGLWYEGMGRGPILENGETRATDPRRNMGNGFLDTRVRLTLAAKAYQGGTVEGNGRGRTGENPSDTTNDERDPAAGPWVS